QEGGAQADRLERPGRNHIDDEVAFMWRQHGSSDFRVTGIRIASPEYPYAAGDRPIEIDDAGTAFRSESSLSGGHEPGPVLSVDARVLAPIDIDHQSKPLCSLAKTPGDLDLFVAEIAQFEWYFPTAIDDIKGTRSKRQHRVVAQFFRNIPGKR